MKLRLHNDTLRLRLNQSEVARLGAGERVEDSISFSSEQTLVFSVEWGTSLSAVFDGVRICVTIPGAQARQWAESREIGISSTAGRVKLLIEKDFQCLHELGAGDPDAFPNPASRH